MNLDLDLFTKLPDPMSKDQFCKVCHISKRTGLYLLQSGLLKAQNTGKKTHCWWIAKIDILDYVTKCTKEPGMYKPPQNWYIYTNAHDFPVGRLHLDAGTRKAAREYYTKLIGKEAGLMTVNDIAKITGYTEAAIKRWIYNGKLLYLCKSGSGYQVPVRFLIEFLISETYNDIRDKSNAHNIAILRISCDATYYPENENEDEAKNK